MANTPQTKNDRSLHVAALDTKQRGICEGCIVKVRSAGQLPGAGYGAARESRMASLEHLAGQYKAGRPLIDVWAQGVALEVIGMAMA